LLDAPLDRTPEHTKDGLLNIMAVGVDRQQLFEIMSAGPSNSSFMGFCKTTL